VKRGDGEGLSENPAVEVRVPVNLGETEGLVEIILRKDC